MHGQCLRHWSYTAAEIERGGSCPWESEGCRPHHYLVDFQRSGGKKLFRGPAAMPMGRRREYGL
jgi:hypothetical protein